MPPSPVTERLIQDGLLGLLRMQLVREVIVPAPAAGAEWAQLVAAGERWELLNVSALLTTSAVVGNRTPRVSIRNADNAQVGNYGLGTTVPATTSGRATWAAGIGIQGTTGGNLATLPSPSLVLLPSWTIITTTTNLDVGDQWSQVILLVRIWSEADVVQVATRIGTRISGLTIDH